MKIIALSGSNSSNSLNTTLLHAVAALTAEDVEVTSIRDHPASLFSFDEQEANGIPQTIADLYARLMAADGVIISSPEYNSSMPGAFKNAIDWMSCIKGMGFFARPVLLLSTSPGERGGMTNLENLVKIMPFWGAEIVDSYSLPQFNSAFSDGQLTDDAVRAELTEKVAGFVAHLVAKAT